MPTNITQSISDADGRLILRVEGDMMLDDALLLEKLALEMRSHYGRDLTVDLADENKGRGNYKPEIDRFAEKNHR